MNHPVFSVIWERSIVLFVYNSGDRLSLAIFINTSPKSTKDYDEYSVGVAKMVVHLYSFLSKALYIHLFTHNNTGGGRGQPRYAIFHL